MNITMLQTGHKLEKNTSKLYKLKSSEITQCIGLHINF